MGRIISKDGIQLDMAKIKAITELPSPTDKTEMKRLLGMVNFLSPFIPNLSSITSPLRALLKEDAAWVWCHEHTEALNKIKEILGKEPILQFFDSAKKTTIQCDSSIQGLGACLLQDGKPIAYASRALVESETLNVNCWLSSLRQSNSTNTYLAKE